MYVNEDRVMFDVREDYVEKARFILYAKSFYCEQTILVGDKKIILG